MNSLKIDPASTLHTLNASPFEYRVLFDRLIRLASPGDSLLLLENGVYAINNTYCLTTIRALGLSLYCLEADIQARGLQNVAALTAQIDGIPAGDKIHLIDDTSFVNLSCNHRKVVSWFP